LHGCVTLIARHLNRLVASRVAHLVWHNAHPASKYGVSLGSCQHSKQPCGSMAKSNFPQLELSNSCYTRSLHLRFSLGSHVQTLWTI